MCKRAVEKDPSTLNSLLISIGPERCMKELLKEGLMHWKLDLLLDSKRLNRCVKELQRNIHIRLMFLTGIRPKGCVNVEVEIYSFRFVPNSIRPKRSVKQLLKERHALEFIFD